MIDLHTHTKYSDGTDDIYQLLSNATKNNIRVLSITDHNSVDCYYEMDEGSVLYLEARIKRLLDDKKL